MAAREATLKEEATADATEVTCLCKRTQRRRHIPPVPVLHIFGSRSGNSHLLHAPNADPSASTITTVQIFRMPQPPPHVQYDRFSRRLRCKPRPFG